MFTNPVGKLPVGAHGTDDMPGAALVTNNYRHLSIDAVPLSFHDKYATKYTFLNFLEFFHLLKRLFN
jgi:hypothetical protein